MFCWQPLPAISSSLSLRDTRPPASPSLASSHDDGSLLDPDSLYSRCTPAWMEFRSSCVGCLMVARVKYSVWKVGSLCGCGNSTLARVYLLSKTWQFFHQGIPPNQTLEKKVEFLYKQRIDFVGENEEHKIGYVGGGLKYFSLGTQLALCPIHIHLYITSEMYSPNNSILSTPALILETPFPNFPDRNPTFT